MDFHQQHDTRTTYLYICLKTSGIKESKKQKGYQTPTFNHHNGLHSSKIDYVFTSDSV